MGRMKLAHLLLLALVTAASATKAEPLDHSVVVKYALSLSPSEQRAFFMGLVHGGGQLVPLAMPDDETRKKYRRCVENSFERWHFEFFEFLQDNPAGWDKPIIDQYDTFVRSYCKLN